MTAIFAAKYKEPMRVPTLAALGVLVLWFPPQFVSAPVLAQTTTCKGTCKQQRKQCSDGFKGQFRLAKQECGKDKQCKTEEKQAFRVRKGECKGAFASCKVCCGSGQTVLCSVSVCGDGLLVTDEECDQGAANSDTTPDACRTSCRSAGCGDRIVDAGEECDPPDQGACDAECIGIVAPPTTSTTEPPATTSTTTTATEMPTTSSESPATTTTTEMPTTSTSAAATTTTFTSSSTSSTSTTVPPVACEGDPTRTIFAGSFAGSSPGPCRQFDGDQRSCEQAYAATMVASVVSCFFDAASSACEGCGPRNESLGACTNTCMPSTP